MKRTTIWIWIAALLPVLLSSVACKKAEVVAGSVSVMVSAGVSGSPAAGDITLNVGDTLAYKYTLEAGYAKLTVLLDGTEVAASGTITITGDHILKAYADDNLEYKLTVTLKDGVNGTPATGTYYYKQGTQVAYSYALKDGFKSLYVLLNGASTTVSGTVTMSKDNVLYASADVKYSVLGAWNLSETYNDGSSFNVVLTFAGTLFGGTVSDSDGGAGTYEFSDDTVDFKLVFPDVTYEYSNGDFTDENTMSGTCKRYQDKAAAVSGTWTATRVTSNAAATPAPMSVSGKKGMGH
jgi:hypothetical protein